MLYFAKSYVSLIIFYIIIPYKIYSFFKVKDKYLKKYVV